MPRLTLLTLAVVAGLVTAVPAGAASLPVLSRTLTAQKGSCDSTSYRAPLTGYLDVRLRGSGDWDLRLRDAAGTTLAASRGFGGREVAQAWVRGGQRITARGCRGRGAGSSARTTFGLATVALPKLPLGPAQLLRVSGSEKQLRALESAGLDVTHAAGVGWADVIVDGAVQLATVVASGLRYSVRIADLSKSYADARSADRRYAIRVGADGTALPTGRTTYRTYDDVQNELKALVDQNAGLVRKVVFGTSYQGREISGVEIARDVSADDGRPVFFLMALHHAREWPSMEAAMEFAHLLVQQQGDARIADLLARERIVILPMVNPDGFISSRGAFDPGDTLAKQDPNVTLAESIAPPGGLFAYRRKNCDGELTPSLPCELAWGVDPNRNYGYGWGGPGSSSDVTSQSYHGPGPRSEPEVKAVWNYVRTHEVTTLLTLHNVAALVLRPPGASTAGLAPDEARMKALGDRMGAAAGYTSEYGFQLYDTTGTTEDDSYAATGGYGYTIEMGPPGGNFHMPYQTGVVDEWTGENAHAQNHGGLREALLVAAGAAADAADHAILRGYAPAGRILRLRKHFETRTSAFCAKGVEPPVDIGLPRICLTGEKAALTLQDDLDATTTVPAAGTYDWHIGQSTRPFVGAIPGQKEAYTLTCEQPDGSVLEHLSLVIDRGQTMTLDLGCGAAPTRFANGAPVGGDPGAPPPSTAPAVNGAPVPAGVAAAAPPAREPAPPAAAVVPKAKAKATTRLRRLATCEKQARRLRGGKQRASAQRSCTRRFGRKKA
ncbi:MAG: carboxypeptidase [Solirubrobacteraceae bacterium]|nr:carboxypeptidase [Solirubrobacteraceae bacterium]